MVIFKRWQKAFLCQALVINKKKSFYRRRKRKTARKLNICADTRLMAGIRIGGFFQFGLIQFTRLRRLDGINPLLGNSRVLIFRRGSKGTESISHYLRDKKYFYS